MFLFVELKIRNKILKGKREKIHPSDILQSTVLNLSWCFTCTWVLCRGLVNLFIVGLSSVGPGMWKVHSPGQTFKCYFHCIESQYVLSDWDVVTVFIGWFALCTTLYFLSNFHTITDDLFIFILLRGTSDLSFRGRGIMLRAWVMEVQMHDT